MKKITVTLTLAIAGLLAFCPGTASADITWNPTSNSFDAMTDYVAFRYFPNNYQPNGIVTISSFGVSTGAPLKHTIFSLISGGPFEPLQTQPPVEQGRAITVNGQKASFEVHGSDHTTFLYRTSYPGNITFNLDSRVGAVPMGSVALVGDQQVQGDLVVNNGRTMTKAVDTLMIRLETNDMVVYRIHGPSGSIGDLLAASLVDVELDIVTIGPTISSDTVSYRTGATLTVDSVGSSRATFSFSGIDGDKISIIDIPSEIYTSLKDHMSVNADGTSLDRFADVQALAQSSESGYAVTEGQTYSEMFVRLGAPSGSLVIESVVPGINLLIIVATLASLGVSVAAGFFLFRRKK